MKQIIFTLVVILTGTMPALAKYSGGTGDPNTPYQIATAEDLNDIGNHTEDFNKCFILVNDINLAAYTGTQFNIIGNYEVLEFNGAFDGNNHTITNFTWDSNDSRIGIGLFGIVSWKGKIKNLAVENASVAAGSNGNWVGILAGSTLESQITNCHVSGTVSGNLVVGGLVGGNQGIITNCYSACNVSGNELVGGLSGYNNGFDQNGIATDCYATGTVSGIKDVGGLVGRNGFYNPEHGKITNCYFIGDVSGVFRVGGLAGITYYGMITNCHSAGTVSCTDSEVGGLVGYNGSYSSTYSNNCSIEKCYSTMNVSGGKWGVGGLVGFNDFGTISDCYAKGTVTAVDAQSYVGGLVGYNRDTIGTITGSYATGTVSGNNYAGGLVGVHYGSITNCYSGGAVSGTGNAHGGLAGCNYGTISNSYSTGAVSGGLNTGGLIGYSSGAATSSFWDTNTSGQITSAGGTGLTTAQMKQQASFVGWNFTTIWAICEGTNYPRLLWSILAADFVCPDGVNFADYSFFTQHWLNTDCASNNNCDGADFDFSGTVDENDLAVLCNYWLQGL